MKIPFFSCFNFLISEAVLSGGAEGLSVVFVVGFCNFWKKRKTKDSLIGARELGKRGEGGADQLIFVVSFSFIRKSLLLSPQLFKRCFVSVRSAETSGYCIGLQICSRTDQFR